MLHSYYYLLLLGIGSYCLSCSSNQSLPNSSSNYEATQKAYPQLIKSTAVLQDHCKAQYSPTFRVLELQGKELYDCLKFQPKALVYTWNMQEDSLKYLPIEKVQQYCDQQGIRLYVVAAYYQGDILSKEYALDYPIIGINTSYYRSNNPIIYHKNFLKDLGIILKEGQKGQLHYFEYGHYHGVHKSLEAI